MKWSIPTIVFSVIGCLLGLLTPVAASSRMTGILVALISLSGVTVTVFGIWVAIIFPKLVSEVESGGKTSGDAERQKYDALIDSLYSACLTMCAGMIVLMVHAFFRNESQWLLRALGIFCWLSLFSMIRSLWISVMSGEVLLANEVNRGLLAGLTRRLIRDKSQ
ncbi:hypothetical protein C7S18_19945 [Ahniella affigens]|uniref:Uncharacterized protein n=1 Tax=Ahniella affigens TaxID=2021234 RepID=A0A2P1PWT8_9GAMM|nr:hypothetical protein [Ahniella affigens]AVP99300.1 hypothetical protein C7S18_19945 [Ahniella affigens]